MTNPDGPSNATDDELVRQVEVAKRWARLLNESRATLDDTRREVFKAVDALISARFDLTVSSSALGDRVSASVLERLDAAEVTLRSLVSAHASGIREDLRNSAVAGASQLADAADVVRGAESSFAGGAELLKSYADTYRVTWIRAAAGLLAEFDRRWEGVAEEQRLLGTEVRASLPVIKEAHQQAAAHAELLAEHAHMLYKLNVNIRRPLREEIAPVHRMQRLTLVLLGVQGVVLLGVAAYIAFFLQ